MELDNTQFYPIEEEKKGPNIDIRKILQILGLIIVIALLIVLIVYLVNSLGDRSTTLDRSEVAEVRSGIDSNCADSANFEVCKYDYVLNLSQSRGDIRICSELAGEDYRDCVLAMSLGDQDLELCGLLSDEDRRRCQNSINRNLAFENNSFDACRQITDESLRNICGTSLAISIYREEGGCNFENEWTPACLSEMEFRTRINNINSPEDCEWFRQIDIDNGINEGGLYDNCLSILNMSSDDEVEVPEEVGE